MNLREVPIGSDVQWKRPSELSGFSSIARDGVVAA